MYAHLTAHPAHIANHWLPNHHAARSAEIAALAAEIERSEGLPYPLALAHASDILDLLLEEGEIWDAIIESRRRAREGA